MHSEALEWIRGQLERRRPRVVLEFGSRDVNGGARAVAPSSVELWWGIDVVSGRGVDEVCEASTYVPRLRPDAIVCAEVLEHAENADMIVANAIGILSRTPPGGGTFIMTCATEGRAPHSAVDGGPLREGEFYRNVAWADAVAWAPLEGVLGSRVGAEVVEILESKERGDLYVAIEVDFLGESGRAVDVGSGR